MNDTRQLDTEHCHALLHLPELQEGAPISQREMAGRLGIAVGLVNAYVKTLVRKGFVQVKAYPRNRYAYLLTPSGFAEKSRLAYQQVTYFHSLFRTARQDSVRLFRHLHKQGIAEVAFCGIDEFTEIAYLSLCDVGMTLAAVYDNAAAEAGFLGRPVQSLQQALATEEPIVITSLRQADDYRRGLVTAGVAIPRIHGPIFGLQTSKDDQSHG